MNMKKILVFVLIIAVIGTVFAGCANTSGAKQSESSPASTAELAASNAVSSPETKQLGVGTMQEYDFGTIKLHAYETKDPISDENFLLETDNELILIELVGFYNNIEELQSYIEKLGKPLTSVIVAYHPAGGDAHPNAQMYASEGLGEAGLIPMFVEKYGDAFNGDLPTKYQIVAPGIMTVGGIEFNVIQTDSAFDLEIPAINAYFTHMVGSNTHNTLRSVDQIDEMIAQMKNLQAKNYSLILTGHDVPRTIDVATEKIDYLEKMKEFIASSESAEVFTQAMKKAFPNYQGENFLEMSAGALFD